MTVADRIGVMNQGRLMQVATPTEIYEQPNSRWVAIHRRSDDHRRQGGCAGRSTDLGDIRRLSAVTRVRKDGVAGAAARKDRHERRAAGRRGRTSVAGTSLELGYRGDMSAYKFVWPTVR
jgi:putrescine transport system ATP-binding protein